MAKKTRQLFKQKGSQNWTCEWQWRDKDGRKNRYCKSLGTAEKQEAWKRYEEINSKLDDLKEGIRFTWSWERKSETSRVKINTVQDAFDKYIIYQETNGFKEGTILGTKDAYRRMVISKCVSPNLPVKALRGINLEMFKEYWTGKHAPNTINQTLNKFKAFLNYCVRKGWMAKYQNVSSTLQAKPISYFTDNEFKALMDALETDELKRAILFYHQTGCRKSEPFIARRVGNTLIIPKMKKSKVERRIVLSPVLAQIHDEMMARYNERKTFVKSDKANWDWWYLGLKKACKQIGLDQKTIHDLRDTYIVRMWAITGDLYAVSKNIGHSNIMQTAEYANYEPQELLEHFPTLEKFLKPRIKVADSLMDGRFLDGSIYDSLRITEGK